MRKKEPYWYYWWEYKLVQPYGKQYEDSLKKLELELPYNPMILLLGIYPKECKTGYSRDTPVHQCSL
jgi:hypothetical protein